MFENLQALTTLFQAQAFATVENEDGIIPAETADLVLKAVFKDSLCMSVISDSESTADVENFVINLAIAINGKAVNAKNETITKAQSAYFKFDQFIDEIVGKAKQARKLFNVVCKSGSKGTFECNGKRFAIITESETKSENQTYCLLMNDQGKKFYAFVYKNTDGSTTFIQADF